MGRKVVRGAAILLVAGVIARVLGFFYRIFLARAIGAQGMGLLAMAYPLMGMALNLSGMGIPVAVAKMVAERVSLAGRSLDNVFRFSFVFVLAVGLVLSVALVLGAPFLSHHLLSDPRSVYPLLAAVPLLLIVPAALVLRGYFQGMQRMEPLAVATVLEQAIRIVFVVYLVRYFLPYGLAWGAVGAMVAVTLGELLGLVILLAFYHVPRLLGRANARRVPVTDPRDRLGPTAREILGLGAPVTGSRMVGSFTEIGDAIIVPRRLEVSGFSRDAATAFYGNFSAMAMPLLFFPTVLTGALAQALMPAISEADALHGIAAVRARTQQALHVTLLMAFPMATLFVALGHVLGLVIYGQHEVGTVLVPLALAAPCIYVDNTLSAVLRGLGRPAVPMTNGLVGSFVRLTLIYILTAKAGAGVAAVLIAFVVDMTITCGLNYRSVHLLVRPRLEILRSIALPIGASLLMAVVSRLMLGAYRPGGHTGAVGLTYAILAGLAVYLGTIYAAGGLKGVSR